MSLQDYIAGNCMRWRDFRIHAQRVEQLLHRIDDKLDIKADKT